MKITAVDNKHDLFCVENLYPDNLLEIFLNLDHLSVPWNKEVIQHEYPRRRLIIEAGSVYEKMNLHINSIIQILSDITKQNFIHADTGYWLDQSGFSMEPHVDNAGVFASMQIFLNNNASNLGTTFYNLDKTVRFRPEYKINTGYIMINNEAQIHGMVNPVPEMSYRISSYTWFYPKT